MSKNKISRGYTSPDRQLSEGDIKRKQKKLSKTVSQMVDMVANPEKFNKKRFDRKSFKAKKTKDQIVTGRSGIRPIKKSPLQMVGVKNPTNLNQKDEIRVISEDFPNMQTQIAGEAPAISNTFPGLAFKGLMKLGSKMFQGSTGKNRPKHEIEKKLDKNKIAEMKLMDGEKVAEGVTSPVKFNDPYAGAYEKGDGEQYFSNREDYQKLFSDISSAIKDKFSDPDYRAKRKEKRADRIDKRINKRVAKGKKGYETTTSKVTVGEGEEAKEVDVTVPVGEKLKKKMTKSAELRKESAELKGSSQAGLQACIDAGGVFSNGKCRKN